LRLIAAKFGVQYNRTQFIAAESCLQAFVCGLYDITVAGRLIAIFPPEPFKVLKNQESVRL
jgi:hypothetical protein